MTSAAKALHAHLRGEEPRTTDEICHDIGVLSRTVPDPVIRERDVRPALAELEALGLATRDDAGRWRWKAKPIEKQGSLF